MYSRELDELAIFRRPRRGTIGNAPQEDSIGPAVACVQYAVLGYINTHIAEISAFGSCELELPHLRRIQSKRSHIANANRNEWNACLVQFVFQLQLFAWYLHIAALLSGVWKGQIGRREQLCFGVFHVWD